jgi:hypothetical protein
MTEKNELLLKVAKLESQLDHLETELSKLNDNLLLCGFPQGLISLKASVDEILAEQAAKVDRDGFSSNF